MSTEAKTAASRTKFPNKTDFALWQAIQPAPQWAKRFASGASPNIDDVVNSHVVSSDSDFARRGRDCDAHSATSMANIKCPRCHGPAEMISKAPPGESGDVVRCDREEQCAREHEAAQELEQAHTGVVDAAHDFYRALGSKTVGVAFQSEIKVPGHVVAALLDAVQDWKDAGEALVATQRARRA